MVKQDGPREETWKAVKSYQYADRKDWRLETDPKAAASDKKSPSLDNPFKGRR
jgi:hypothetical protein